MKGHDTSSSRLASPLILALALALPVSGVALEPLPRDLELELASSTLPEHLRADATVYLLDPDFGYRVAREGTNGFHAFIARTEYGAFLGSWPYTSYRDDILVPIAFDEPGAATHMRVYFDVATERARGTEPAKLKELINRRFADGYYGPPERPGIAYMLAPIVRGYQRAEEHDHVVTFSLPHYMYYAPGVTNEDLGARGFSVEHPFMLYRAPHPHGLIIHIAGEKERMTIREDRKELLARLCALKTEFCLSDG